MNTNRTLGTILATLALSGFRARHLVSSSKNADDEPIAHRFVIETERNLIQPPPVAYGDVLMTNVDGVLICAAGNSQVGLPRHFLAIPVDFDQGGNYVAFQPQQRFLEGLPDVTSNDLEFNDLLSAVFAEALSEGDGQHIKDAKNALAAMLSGAFKSALLKNSVKSKDTPETEEAEKTEEDSPLALLKRLLGDKLPMPDHFESMETEGGARVSVLGFDLDKIKEFIAAKMDADGEHICDDCANNADCPLPEREKWEKRKKAQAQTAGGAENRLESVFPPADIAQVPVISIGEAKRLLAQSTVSPAIEPRFLIMDAGTPLIIAIDYASGKPSLVASVEDRDIWNMLITSRSEKWATALLDLPQHRGLGVLYAPVIGKLPIVIGRYARSFD
jgi:hypothetical protein